MARNCETRGGKSSVCRCCATRGRPRASGAGSFPGEMVRVGRTPRAGICCGWSMAGAVRSRSAVSRRGCCVRCSARYIGHDPVSGAVKWNPLAARGPSSRGLDFDLWCQSGAAPLATIRGVSRPIAVFDGSQTLGRVVCRFRSCPARHSCDRGRREPVAVATGTGARRSWLRARPCRRPGSLDAGRSVPHGGTVRANLETWLR